MLEGKEIINTYKKKFKLKELELNALLEITQAINNNLTEEKLYRIYQFTLRGNLNVKKVALYVLDDQWECKVNFGTKANFAKIKLEKNFLNTRIILPIHPENQQSPFRVFERVVPVVHKEKLLALVFVGEFLAEEYVENDADLSFLQALSNIILVAIENKKLARKQLQQEALRKELEIAQIVQNYLFPKNLPQTSELTVNASYFPHQAIGGDYYDFVPINEHKFLFCIADVSGKGIPAALLMSNFQASLRTLARKTSSLQEIVKELNYQILQNAQGESFITFFVAMYDKQHHTLHYINAGHNQPLLITQKKTKLLKLGTTVLGFFHPLPFLNEGIITDLSEFFFFAYTDGLTETFNEKEEEFGPERVEEFIEAKTDEDFNNIHTLLIKRLDRFRGNKPYNDDITMLSINAHFTKK